MHHPNRPDSILMRVKKEELSIPNIITETRIHMECCCSNNPEIVLKIWVALSKIAMLWSLNLAETKLFQLCYQDTILSRCYLISTAAFLPISLRLIPQALTIQGSCSVISRDPTKSNKSFTVGDSFFPGGDMGGVWGGNMGLSFFFFLSTKWCCFLQRAAAVLKAL